MRISSSTTVNTLAPVTTIGSLKTLFAEMGFEKGEIDTLIDIGSGVSILEAMKKNGIFDKNKDDAANNGTFRSRMSRAVVSLTRNVMKPVADACAEEIALNAQADAKSEADAVMAKWIAGGRIGRKPRQTIDPVVRDIRTAYQEAVQATRTAIGLNPIGRIPFELQADYHNSLTSIFTAKLTALKKTVALPDTIENIVAERIEPLDTDALEAMEVENAIAEALKKADKDAREEIGHGAKGRVSGEMVDQYNEAATASLKKSLTTLAKKMTLPDTVDNLIATRLQLYVPVKPARRKRTPAPVPTPAPVSAAHKTVKNGKNGKTVEANHETEEKNANAEVEAALAE